MKTIEKADKFFQKILLLEKAIGALSLFAMLCICFFAVIMRYAFNSPWTWSEEVILILLVIFGFMCISVDIYNDEHIALCEVRHSDLSDQMEKAAACYRMVTGHCFCRPDRRQRADRFLLCDECFENDHPGGEQGAKREKRERRG